MDKRGIVPIVEKFPQPNFLLSLEVREGFIFGRIVRRRVCSYRPYKVIDANGTTVDIAASSAQDTLRLRDPRNTESDILYLDNKTNSDYGWLYYGSIGLKPQWVYMYPSYPEVKGGPGHFPEIDPVRPGSGDDFGKVTSLESPYDNPTDYIEYVILPGQHLGLDFYNKDTAKAHQPVLNLLFALLWVQWFNKDKQEDLIRKIALREVPAMFLQHGWDDTPIEAGALIKEWDATAYKSLDEAGGR